MKWLLLILGILTNASASILVKFAAGKPLSVSQPFAAGNVRMGSAIFLYFAAFILYSAAVTRLPLAVAHPIMTAGAIVLVGLSAVFVFAETVTTIQAIGYGFLLIGIVCIAVSHRATI